VVFEKFKDHYGEKNNVHNQKRRQKLWTGFWPPNVGRIGPNPFDPVSRRSEVLKTACAPK
jgi:hypothetical protein